jgi:hypothetical protein
MQGGSGLGRLRRRLASVVAATAATAAAGCGGADAPASTPAAKTSSGDPAPSSAPPADPAAPAAPSSPTVLSAGAGGGSWPAVAQSPDDRQAQLDRLKKDPGPLKSNWVPPGRSDRYGHAEGIVAAPIDQVRAKLADFGHYKDLAGPKFKSVKVVDKQGDLTDVYFQLPIMKGLVTIWYVTRFAPPRAAQGSDVVEGTYVKGNIKGMHIAFTVRPGADDKSSVMVCDLVLQPNVPAPQSALDEELRDACGDAINATRRTLGLIP